MNKICTSIKQSKKLLELGLKPETADMYWDFQISGYILIVDELGYYKNDSEIPAWSLTALLELIPSDFTAEGSTYKIDFRKYRFSAEIEVYQIAYGNNETISGNWKDMINTSECENSIDAAYEMIVWLLENKKI